ncbi:FAD-dependent oxidoreductase [Actinomyces minihominis]|uniref:FAD-dependent oxidoreductase n=1 Tax=Actinomyces minihominis TaxID=2002838 RepID=UPI000C08AE32|nr:FAD-dependent oxidoreductase [Actinomyces minihominis]
MRTVVVGGVATGMSAAARLRRLDETVEIIVLEQGPYVSYANCGLPYYVGGEIEDDAALLVQTPEKLKASLNLDVRTGHDVVALDTDAKALTVRVGDREETLTYDNLVLAPGAVALRPNLPGFDSDLVWHLRTVPDALEMRRRIEAGDVKQAVVLGAGFIGLEAAEALAEQGVKTTIVELAPHVLPPAEPEVAARLTDELSRLGITVRDGVAAVSIEKKGDSGQVNLADGSSVEADLVVLSIGVRPATEIFTAAGLKNERGALIVDDHGRTSAPNVWAGGDAVASLDPLTGALRPVALAGPANRAGRLIADDIAGSSREGAKPRPFARPLGTAVVRVGNLTAAMVGANSRTLDAAGIEYHTANTHPMDHAGYFPGAVQIHLTVHFAKEDGAILGAQAVGPKGVDKRIDVISTAMLGGLKIDDLIDVDLAYSPPYGSAKDPVNMIGYYGQNVMDGVTKLWYASEIPEVLETSLVLDVRSVSEFASGHLEGALNIPHTELRARLDEVREAAGGRPVRVHCQSGVRSFLAERILVQEGFDDVRNLSGGMLTIRDAIAGGVIPEVEIIK